MLRVPSYFNPSSKSLPSNANCKLQTRSHHSPRNSSLLSPLLRDKSSVHLPKWAFLSPLPHSPILKPGGAHTNFSALCAFTYNVSSCLEALVFCLTFTSHSCSFFQVPIKMLFPRRHYLLHQGSYLFSLSSISEGNKNGPERSLLLTANSCFSQDHFLLYSLPPLYFLSLPIFISFLQMSGTLWDLIWWSPPFLSLDLIFRSLNIFIHKTYTMGKERVGQIERVALKHTHYHM